MSTDTKPSAGAMRAARKIDDCVESYCTELVPSVKELAEIIDREVAELVEAFTELIRELRHPIPAYDPILGKIATHKAGSALRRFKEEL